MDNGAVCYRRFLDGDDNAFVDIIKDYKDGLTLYLWGITGNPITAEDLTEDAFVKLVTKKPRFSGKSIFKTWLYSIARNIAYDFLRKNPKGMEISTEELLEIQCSGDLLEQAYIKEEEKIELHKAMDTLPPQYKQVLWLTYFEELSNKDVAMIMHKSVHSIETMLYRARICLREKLEKEGFVYERL